jgi:hypothetical protein
MCNHKGNKYSCKHEHVRYCPDCGMLYCEDCGFEFGVVTKQVEYVPYPVYVPSYPYIMFPQKWDAWCSRTADGTGIV